MEDAETDLEVAVIDFQDRLAELENEQSELEEAKQVKKGTQSNTSMLRVCDRHAEWAERELLRVPGLVEPVYSLTAAKKIATRHGKIKAAMVDRTAAVQRIVCICNRLTHKPRIRPTHRWELVVLFRKFKTSTMSPRISPPQLASTHSKRFRHWRTS